MRALSPPLVSAAFFIALADAPQLGVSHTVWAHVASEDLDALDSLAMSIDVTGRMAEAGSRAMLPLPSGHCDGRRLLAGTDHSAWSRAL